MDTVIYYGERFDALALSQLEGAHRAEDGSVVEPAPSAGLSARRWVGLADEVRAAAYLRLRPVDAMVLDARGVEALERARSLLATIYPDGRMSGPILRQRILGLVEEGPAGNEAAFALGKLGLGAVAVAPDPAEIARRVDGLLAHRGHGKIAICLAGGGIEGLLYEVGVLRALDAFLVDRSVVDVDLFCGISAGAILGALLANGVGPDEILRALEGGSTRVDPIRRLDLFEPNLGEVGQRLVGLVGELVRGGVGPRGVLSSLAHAVPSAAFSGRRLGSWLERQLTRPGMSDRFADLRRPLYVGATDQDTSEAVIFGEGALSEVPVHRAVHASCALVPFYPPVEIDGRVYTDGAFSRTTNMRVAAASGATLVILVDPLVPVRSARAGYVRERGGIYCATQGLKTLINGRFDKAVHAISEMYPDVAFHLFRPEGDEMRILAGSPMKYFYRREVAEIAYRTTHEKIRASLPQLQRDFGLHGCRFEEPDRPSVRPPPPVAGLRASELGL